MILSPWFSGCGSLNPLFDQDSNLGLPSFWLLESPVGGLIYANSSFSDRCSGKTVGFSFISEDLSIFFLYFSIFSLIFCSARQAEPCDSGRHLSESLSLRLGRVAFPGARAVGCHESKCLPLQAEGDGGPWGTRNAKFTDFIVSFFQI